MRGRGRFLLVSALSLASVTIASQATPLPVQGAPTPTFHGLTPARVLDTRPGNPTVDNLRSGEGPIGPRGVITLTIAGRGGVPLTGANAVALNVTAIGGTEQSYITIWPTGLVQPTASNLNPAAGATTPNMVIVPLGTGGQVDIANDAGTVNLAVDVLGWFPTGGGYRGVLPTRYLDTRSNGSTFDDAWVRTGYIGSGSDTEVGIVEGSRGTDVGGVVPADAVAVAINLTVTGPTKTSYMTVFPSGAAVPTASTLNYTPNATLANMAIVSVGANGKIDLWNNDGFVYGIVDVLGYFPSGTAFTGLIPARLMDTRRFAPTVDLLFSGKGKIGPQTSTNLTVTNRGGVPATGVGAVVLNVTVTNPTVPSFLTVWPTGVDKPTASNLNFVPNQTVANMVIVPVGADGQISLFNSEGATDAIVDVLGWFPTEAG